ncbi:hypothetical protein [Kribbella sp. C-35]|uniref:hypothetical protein n=1 Tax=Kribbella sp. C-35 TaxID=2789276 RepID=UPI00397A4B54
MGSADEIAHKYGADATQRSLSMIGRVVAVEPAVTNQFLDSLPPGASPYQLNRRVKSPESLARKIADWEQVNDRLAIDDLLRYTVLTGLSDEVVAAARRTVDSLNDRGWRVRYAMHSYTEGSRYKGLHAHLSVPGSPRVEIQFHSAASAKVKELTTPWYEIERSTTATAEERSEARQRCCEASATLELPRGIDGLTRLGGQRVKVKNYSQYRMPAGQPAPSSAPQAPHPTRIERNGGIAR